ncbi:MULTISPECIES: retropepsin-like aspartic peptidase RloA3 [Halomonas]|uniref:ATP-dependent zinc protease n=1 Tax=Halomonas casei TaxID=2742613 RepID=A0ABR9F5L4_9GAMM|nr:ATP-dependent zinc protease [Halomonas casei]MBE0401733.1 ATP-dependent zinc protease [Halomonas casei]
MRVLGKTLLGSAVIGALLSTSTAMADDDQVFGWVENATLQPWDITVKAKLDSGALTSSLDARDIELFEQEDEEWVRFRLKLEDQDSGEVFSDEIERPLYREQTVRGAGGSDDRPVILMEVCMGDTIYEEQFSLRDREEMIYPMLLGRSTISHLGLLDVRNSFLQEPGCDENSQVVPHDPEDDQS